PFARWAGPAATVEWIQCAFGGSVDYARFANEPALATALQRRTPPLLQYPRGGPTSPGTTREPEHLCIIGLTVLGDGFDGIPDRFQHACSVLHGRFIRLPRTRSG